MPFSKNNFMTEHPAERMTLAQLLTHTEKLARGLTEHFRNILPAQLAEFRDLTRPVRRRSVFPTKRVLANALAKLQQLDQETLNMINQLEDLLQKVYQRSKPEQDNRRDAVRREGQLLEVFLIKRGSQEQPFRGWVFDRSAGGLGITVPQEIPVGTWLRVLPVKVPRKTPWVTVKVRNCRAGEEGWEIGCQFQVTPPWPVLALFG